MTLLGCPLKLAIDVCHKYRDANKLATGAWDQLMQIARGHDKAGDRSHVLFYEQATNVTVNWPALSDCRPADERRDEPLSSKITRAWNYLEAISVDEGSIISMSTESGGVEVVLPTEHPAFTIRTAYLQCFATLTEEILKNAHVRVQATSAGGGKYQTQILAAETPALGSGTADVETLKTSEALKYSPVLAQMIFTLNREKLSDAYFKDLQVQYDEVKSSLNQLGLWETVTTAAFNPSVQFKGGEYARTFIRDDALFDDTSLRKTVDSLQDELRIRGKKLKIPLTSYDARIDLAVVLTGVILLFLQLAYMFTLRNVVALAPHASKEGIAFFPWPIFWDTRTASHIDKSFTFRPVVLGLAFAHCFLASAVLAWLAVSMLRFGTELFSEFAIALACCLLTGYLGYLCFASIQSVERVVSHHHKLPREA
jgi:hypothetical protein